MKIREIRMATDAEKRSLTLTPGCVSSPGDTPDKPPC